MQFASVNFSPVQNAFQSLDNWLTVTGFDVATPVQNLKNEVSLDQRPIKKPSPIFESGVIFIYTKNKSLKVV